jgi:hypothetical protein
MRGRPGPVHENTAMKPKCLEDDGCWCGHGRRRGDVPPVKPLAAAPSGQRPLQRGDHRLHILGGHPPDDLRIQIMVTRRSSHRRGRCASLAAW